MTFNFFFLTRWMCRMAEHYMLLAKYWLHFILQYVYLYLLSIHGLRLG